MKELRAVLANRNLELLMLGRLVSSGGDWLYSIALSVAVFQYSHHNTFLISVLWIARLVPTLLTGVPGGALADRLGYRRAMILADVSRGILIGSLGLILNTHTWPVIFGYVIVNESIANVFRPASRGLIPQVVQSSDEYLAANASMWGVDSVAMLGGAALGGVIAGMGLINQLLLVEAGTFAVSAITLFLIHTHKPEVTEETEEQEEEDVGGGMLAGLQVTLKRPALVFAVSSIVPTEFADGALVVWFIPYAYVAMHLGSAGLGYLYAAQGIGAIVGAALAATFGGNTRLDLLLAVALVVGGAGYIILGVVPIAVVALTAATIMGIAGTIEFSAYEALLQQSVPQGVVGRVDGTIGAAFDNTMLIGTMASGLVAAWLGLEHAIAALGIVILGATGLAWWNFQRQTAERPTATSLGRIPVFAGLPFSEREWAVRRMARERYPRGAVVIRQGDIGDKFYALAKGKVRVDVQQDGHVATHEMGPGEVFGEIALIENVPRTATITALTPLITFVLSREDFDELRGRASEFGESLLDISTTRRTRDRGIFATTGMP